MFDDLDQAEKPCEKQMTDRQAYSKQYYQAHKQEILKKRHERYHGDQDEIDYAIACCKNERAAESELHGSDLIIVTGIGASLNVHNRALRRYTR